MASQIIREWSGINTFAPATQTKLLELLGKLKQEVLFLFILLNYTLVSWLLFLFYCCIHGWLFICFLPANFGFVMV